MEPLEQRELLASDAIIVGRELSSWVAPNAQGGALKVTYTVYNPGPDSLAGVRLTTSLAAGIGLLAATGSPSRAGQNLEWNIGTIPGLSRSSVEVTFSRSGPATLQVDVGARASASLGGAAVNDSAPAARLLASGVDPALLASTADANWSDPYIQARAAELDYDPVQIFAFLRDGIGYESYEGSLRGARGALWSGAGNSLDEASLGVALFRASGIPARYARGTLPEPLARKQILSMFPEPLRVVGLINDQPLADPAHDPRLIAEASDHAWAEFDAGAGFTAADGAFTDAVLGQTYAAPVQRFTEVAQADRHQVRFTVTVETYRPFAGLLGLGFSEKTPLAVTLDTVDLVGKPVTLGHFVQGSSIGTPLASLTTYTYSPYLRIDDGDDPDLDVIIREKDYQESYTNFALGSEIVTGVWLDVSVVQPERGGARESETFRKEVLDRVGFAARRGAQSVAIASGSTPRSAFAETDALTVLVAPSRLDPAAAGARSAEVGRLSTAIDAALPALRSADGPTKADAQRRVNGLSRDLLREINSLTGEIFLSRSTDAADYSASASYARIYPDSPRLIVLSGSVRVDEAGTATQKVKIDLLRNDLRVEVAPIQSAETAALLRFEQGFSDSLFEGFVLEEALAPAGFTVSSAMGTFLAGLSAGHDLTTLTDADLARVSGLSVSDQARARITAALKSGLTVYVPNGLVDVGGRPTVAWLEADLASGSVIAVAEDGSHDGTAESAAAYDLANTEITALIEGGSEVAAETTATTVADSGGELIIQSVTKDVYAGVAKAKSNREWKALVKAALETYKTVNSRKALDLVREGNRTKGAIAIEFVKLFSEKIDNKITRLMAQDPPVDGFLLEVPASGRFDGLTAGAAGAPGVAVVRDPLTTVPFQGVELPTAFLVGILNPDPVRTTFELSAVNVTPGFTARFSVTRVTIPAGATAEVGAYLIPSGTLPAPGTAASLDVLVSRAGASGPPTTQTATLVVPEVHGVELRLDPPSLNTLPGLAVSAGLTVRAVGNVPETVALSAELPAGVVLAGLPPSVSLAPGETRVVMLTVTPDPSTPLNTTRTIRLSATPSAGAPFVIAAPVRVVVPGVVGIADAATAAAALGDDTLRDRLDALADALSALVGNPADPVLASTALANLDGLTARLGADPRLSTFTSGLTAARGPLAEARTSDEVQAAVLTLGAVLDDLGGSLSDLVKHRFDLVLPDNDQTAQPENPSTFPVLIQNLGTETTTYRFSVQGVPDGVLAEFNVPSITLAPGQSSTSGGPGEVVLTLTQTSPTELSAFGFQVVATADEAPGVSLSAAGALTARREFVSVVSVTADPPFIEPGGTVSVSARLLNAVNREQSAFASFTVENAAGETVFTSAPTPVTLGVATSLTTLSLGALDTTGLTPGAYVLRVRLDDGAGQPVPGGTGEGTLLVGSPVTASLSASPTNLPPGTSTVTNTLEVTSLITPPDPLGLVGQATAAGASDAVRYGDYVYVAGTSGIRVFDISGSKRSAPQLLRVVGTSAFILQIRGDLLVAVRNGSSSSRLDTYSLADPANPAHLGSTGDIPYGSAASVVLTDTHAFVTFVNFIFTFTRDIVAQNGGVLAINIENPASPFLDGDAVTSAGTDAGRDGVNDGVLFNDFGTSNDGVGRVLGIDQSGGGQNIWDAALASPSVLLVMGSSATGTDTQNGVGLVRVIDISDPSNMRLIRDVQIPGTVHAFGIAVEGSRALVTATEGGISDFTQGFPFLGNTVLAVLDLTDPADPRVLHTQKLDTAARGITFDAALGGGLFAFGNGGATGSQSQLHLVDASDPQNLVVASRNVPAGSPNPQDGGDLVLSVDGSNLILYEILGPPGVPATAEVRVPRDTGVSVDAASFSTAPAEVRPGAGFDTYVFNLNFTAGAPSRTITWQSVVSGMQPGEVRDVTLGGTVAFTSQGASGELPLSPTSVSAAHLIGLDPASRTTRPGAPAPFTLTLANPSASGVTYSLAVEGVPAGWSDLPVTVDVPAGGSVSLPFTLTSEALATLGDHGFTVRATNSAGGAGSVSGRLTLQGDPVMPDVEAHGVVAQVLPSRATAGVGTSAAYVVRLFNTGSVAETFALSLILPDGVEGQLGQPEVELLPGASNFREVPLILTARAGVRLGANGFSVRASGASVSATADGTLDVVGNGVGVALAPTSNVPGQPFLLTVTNTGAVADTFDLALVGPGAFAASLNAGQVTLAPGESRVVPVSTRAAGFSVPGALDLTATATSRGNTAVTGASSAVLTIAATSGVSARFDPPTRQLAAPGKTTFLLRVTNLGNLEGGFSVRIVGAHGPVTARLKGAAGLTSQGISVVRMPGFAGAVIVLEADAKAGKGTIDVEIVSLDDPGVRALATATVTVAAPAPTPTRDVTGPVITSLVRVGYHAQPTYLVLTFSEPLDPVRANNPAYYHLLGPATTDRRGARFVPQIPLIAVAYNPATRTVVLAPRQRLSLWKTYFLAVSGVTDRSGNLLDGDRDGRPGGVFTAPVNRRLLVRTPPPVAKPALARQARVATPLRAQPGSARK